MTTIWKPRGAQRPKIQPSEGIRPQHLTRFCRDAQLYFQGQNDQEQSVTFEILADYFEKDYVLGQPLRFSARAVGG